MNNIIPKIVDKIYEDILLYLSDEGNEQSCFIFSNNRDFQSFLLDRLLEIYKNKNNE